MSWCLHLMMRMIDHNRGTLDRGGMEMMVEMVRMVDMVEEMVVMAEDMEVVLAALVSREGRRISQAGGRPG